MHSIRTKTILLNVLAIIISILTATLISVISIATMSHSDSERTLRLYCQDGKNSLNYYFKSVEQSANTVSDLIEADLRNTDVAHFQEHITRAESMFDIAASLTNGALTYYYHTSTRISEEIIQTPESRGFYTTYNEETKQMEAFGASDLTQEGTYPWFYEPKNQGKAVWLPPYHTENYGAYVVSYNVPIYQDMDNPTFPGEEAFVGVIGIEIGWKALGEQIADIKVNKTGFAYIVDSEGTIIYHPDTDLTETPPEQRPPIPKAILKSIAEEKKHEEASGDPNYLKGAHLEYSFESVKKHACWTELSNDMYVFVAVPLSEVNSGWVKLTIEIIGASLIIIGVFIFITIIYANRFTKPLRELTRAAEEIDKGNYKVKIEYHGNDEIAILSSTFNKLISDLDGYISDLNSLAYADALTEVRNKSAFDVVARELQNRMDNKDDNVEFAIAVLDCDDLKEINDTYGHDKGDVYLKNSCHLICRVFKRSPVFRVGGDEFAVLLQGEDYQHREKLKRYFIEKSAEICAFSKEPWENISVAIGIAVYNATIDKTVEDVMIRADHLMYDNKHERKQNKK